MKNPWMILGRLALASLSVAAQALLGAATSHAAALDPPSNTNALPSSETRIEVNWQDNSSGETGFELRRSSNGPNGTFNLLVTTGPAVTGHSDAGLNAATQYCYQVRAFKVNGRKTNY